MRRYQQWSKLRPIPRAMAMITELDNREIAAEDYEFDLADVKWNNKAAPVMLHHITVRTGR